MTSRIGYNVHNKMTYGRDWSAEEKTYFIQHVERLRPTTLLFLGDTDMARDVKRRLPDCAVVYRHHRKDDAALHLTLTPQQTYDEFARYGDGGLIVNILNEPSGYVAKDTPRWLYQMADWCADVMRLFARAGIPVVLPNWGVGHPDERRFDELRVLWQAFAEMPMHYYGIHEYWSWRGIEPGNGRVARYLWWEAYMKDAGFNMPQTLVTEWGIDSALDGTPQRGYHDSRNGAQYAKECIEAIQLYRPYVVGAHIFSWGNTGQQYHAEDWVTFDVSHDTDLHKALETEAMRIVDINPGVDDTRWIPYDAIGKNAPAIVRQNPATSSARLTTIPGNAITHLHIIPPDTMTQAELARSQQSDGQWYLIKLPTNVIGWVRGDVVTLTRPPAPPAPEPEPEPPPDEDTEILYITRPELQTILSAFADDLKAWVTLHHLTKAETLRAIDSAVDALPARLMIDVRPRINDITRIPKAG